jgi:hypothetical protein
MRHPTNGHPRHIPDWRGQVACTELASYSAPSQPAAAADTATAADRWRSQASPDCLAAASLL